MFLYAARYGRAGERAPFLARAHYFFARSTATLAESPTRALARPTVLLLSNGYMVAGFDERQLEAACEEEPRTFAPAVPFVPQKIAAKRRLAGAAAVFVAVFVLAVIAVVL